jgi:hypothetical protein
MPFGLLLNEARFLRWSCCDYATPVLGDDGVAYPLGDRECASTELEY